MFPRLLSLQQLPHPNKAGRWDQHSRNNRLPCPQQLSYVCLQKLHKSPNVAPSLPLFTRPPKMPLETLASSTLPISKVEKLANGWLDSSQWWRLESKGKKWLKELIKKEEKRGLAAGGGGIRVFNFFLAQNDTRVPKNKAAQAASNA